MSLEWIDLMRTEANDLCSPSYNINNTAVSRLQKLSPTAKLNEVTGKTLTYRKKFSITFLNITDNLKDEIHRKKISC